MNAQVLNTVITVSIPNELLRSRGEVGSRAGTPQSSPVTHVPPARRTLNRRFKAPLVPAALAAPGDFPVFLVIESLGC